RSAQHEHEKYIANLEDRLKRSEENLKDVLLELENSELDDLKKSLKMDVEAAVVSQNNSDVYVVPEAWFDQHTVHIASDYSEETKPAWFEKTTLVDSNGDLKQGLRENRDFVVLHRPTYIRICK